MNIIKEELDRMESHAKMGGGTGVKREITVNNGNFS